MSIWKILQIRTMMSLYSMFLAKDKKDEKTECIYNPFLL